MGLGLWKGDRPLNGRVFWYLIPKEFHQLAPLAEVLAGLGRVLRRVREQAISCFCLPGLSYHGARFCLLLR